MNHFLRGEKNIKAVCYHNSECLVAGAVKPWKALCVLCLTVTLLRCCQLFKIPYDQALPSCQTYGELTVVFQHCKVWVQHLTVNHSLQFVDPQTGAHTQNVERSWKSAKERNKRHNGTHRNMLDSYLCEWMWRQRYKNIDLFHHILTNVATYWPPQ